MRYPTSRPRVERAGGSVLLYVIFVVLLLSLFVASVGSQARFALDLSERLWHQLRAAAIARGALQRAALALERDRTSMVDGLNDSWADLPELFQSHPLAGGTFTIIADDRAMPIRYGLADEERRLNLNTAPAEVLAQLAQVAAELHADDAAKLAAAVEDWRDPDDQERPSGAERSYYQSLLDGYACKDGPFENVEELLLVRGVSPQVYRQLEPYVTVYGSGRVNLNTASRTVLQALGLSETGVAGLVAFRAGEDDHEMTGDDRTLAAIDGLESELKSYVPVEDLARLAQLATKNVLTIHSEAFRMVVQADDGQSASRVTARSVIDRHGRIQLWSEQ